MNNDARSLLFDEIYLPMEKAWLRQWEKKGIFPFFIRLTKHFPEEEKELNRLEEAVTKAAFDGSPSRWGIQQACVAYWTKMHAVAKKAVAHEAWRSARVPDPENRRPVEPAADRTALEVARPDDRSSNPAGMPKLRQGQLLEDPGPHRQDGL